MQHVSSDRGRLSGPSDPDHKKHGAARAVCALALFLVLNGPARAAHPLITEDTGTQGGGRWQLETTVDHNRNRINGALEIEEQRKLVLSYGATESLDVIVGVPHYRIRTAGETVAQGRGDMELGAKWRFLVHEGLSLALRPGATAPTGDEDRGLGTGKPTASLFGILSYDLAPWALHLHIGRTDHRNVGDERRRINHYSVAATRRIGAHVQLVADLSQETHPDPYAGSAARSVVLGVIYAVHQDLDVDVGYRAGLSDSASDEALLFGLTFRF